MKYFNQWDTGAYSMFNCGPTLAASVLNKDKPLITKLRSGQKSPLFWRPETLAGAISSYGGNAQLKTVFDLESYLLKHQGRDKFVIICLNMFRVPRSDRGKNYITPWPWWGHFLLLSEMSLHKEAEVPGEYIISYWDTWSGQHRREYLETLDRARVSWNFNVIEVD